MAQRATYGSRASDDITSSACARTHICALYSHSHAHEKNTIIDVWNAATHLARRGKREHMARVAQRRRRAHFAAGAATNSGGRATTGALHGGIRCIRYSLPATYNMGKTFPPHLPTLRTCCEWRNGGSGVQTGACVEGTFLPRKGIAMKDRICNWRGSVGKTRDTAPIAAHCPTTALLPYCGIPHQHARRGLAAPQPLLRIPNDRRGIRC